MWGTADDTRGAVNQYFQTLAKETPDASVSLMSFSEGNFRVLCSAVEPSRVPLMDGESYSPNGGTPLYDAIGKAVAETERVKADKYVLIILSDGKENASREWTQGATRTLLETKQGDGNWTVVYLGANQDAILSAQAVGVGAGNTISYAQSASGIAATMGSLSRATGQTVSSNLRGTQTFFADAGQTAADYQEPEKPADKQEGDA